MEERALVFIVLMLSMPSSLYAMKEAWGDCHDGVICLSNQDIGDLNCVAWGGYENPAKIEKLDLSYNNLTLFQLAPVLRRFPLLKKLDLSNNKIQTITAEFLDGMPDRFSLDLSHNPIATISVGDEPTKIGSHGIVIDLRGHQLNDKAIGILRSVIVRELSLRDKAKLNAGSCGHVVGGSGLLGGFLMMVLASAGPQNDWDPALTRKLFICGGASIAATLSCCIASVFISFRYESRILSNRLITSDEV